MSMEQEIRTARADRVKKRPVTVWFDELLKKEVKRAIVDRDMTITSFMEKAAIDLLKKLSNSHPE